MFRFSFINAPEEPCIHLPAHLSVTIGRSEQCDVQLKDASVSRIHCRVIAVDDRVRLQDLGSRWGTFVNGIRTEHCDLRPGDQLRIGETVLLLDVNSTPDHPTIARPSELVRPEQLLDQEIPGVLDGPVAAEAWNPQSQRPFPGYRRDTNEVFRVLSKNYGDIRTNHRQRVSPGSFCGRHFGGFHVLAVTEESPQGIVFKATSTITQQQVDLEILHPACFVSLDHFQMFLEAGQLASAMRHSGIVSVIEHSCWQGWPYVATEHSPRQSLRQLVRQNGIAGMLSQARVLQIAVDLCDALQYFERWSLLHQKVQPQNVVIRTSDHLAVLTNMTCIAPVYRGSDTRLTMPQMFPEDVGYFAPEQLGGGFLCDHRSDLYQLGVTLYELLSGHPPFDGGSVAALVESVQSQEPALLRTKNMSVAVELEAIVMRLLRKNPRDRFQSAGELRIALEAFRADAGRQRVPAANANPDATGWRGAL